MAAVTFLALTTLATVSCGGAATPEETAPPAPRETSISTTTLTTRTPAPSTSSETVVRPEPEEVVTTVGTLAPPPETDDYPAQGLHPLVRQATAPWPTDWSVRSIDLGELLLGIQRIDPRDAIPPIDYPDFEPVEVASGWLEGRTPGVLVVLDGEARFYPLGVLHRHEIVNDEIGGLPVAVTYCPLCNTALAFDRRVNSQVLRFGVSGLLRNSDLVMWDDASVSLWQQVTGEAIVGSATGTVLAPIPTAIVAFGEFASSYPGGQALSGNGGTPIRYNVNPYVGYSTQPAPYPFFTGEVDPRYPALERVVGVTEGGAATAYPFPVISEVGAVNDSVGGVPVAVFWGGDTADALDTREVSEGRSIGTGVAYRSTVNGGRLSFTKEGDLFVDRETSSVWTLLGEAISGPLQGSRLELAVHRNEFWFVWGAFFPDGSVYEG